MQRLLLVVTELLNIRVNDRGAKKSASWNRVLALAQLHGWKQAPVDSVDSYRHLFGCRF